MQDRGLAAYIAELVGTFFLVFVDRHRRRRCSSPTGPAAQTGSDFAVVGLVHAFVLFVLIITFGAVSGGHFNPAVTIAAAVLRRIDPVDAVVYILAQLSGGVLGALLVKGDPARRGPRGQLRRRGDQPAARRHLRRRRASRRSGPSCSCSRSARWRSTRAPARSGRRCAIGTHAGLRA